MMKTQIPVALLISLLGLWASASYAADNNREKARKLTTAQKLEQLNDRQHVIVQWQEQQQRQLQEMSQRLNAARTVTTSSQSPAYSYP